MCFTVRGLTIVWQTLSDTCDSILFIHLQQWICIKLHTPSWYLHVKTRGYPSTKAIVGNTFQSGLCSYISYSLLDYRIYSSRVCSILVLNWYSIAICTFYHGIRGFSTSRKISTNINIIRILKFIIKLSGFSVHTTQFLVGQVSFFVARMFVFVVFAKVV